MDSALVGGSSGPASLTIEIDDAVAGNPHQMADLMRVFSFARSALSRETA